MAKRRAVVVGEKSETLSMVTDQLKGCGFSVGQWPEDDLSSLKDNPPKLVVFVAESYVFPTMAERDVESLHTACPDVKFIDMHVNMTAEKVRPSMLINNFSVVPLVFVSGGAAGVQLALEKFGYPQVKLVSLAEESSRPAGADVTAAHCPAVYGGGTPTPRL